MALHGCDEVAVAGFGYDMNTPNAPLHYYETVRMAAIKEVRAGQGGSGWSQGGASSTKDGRQHLYKRMLRGNRQLLWLPRVPRRTTLSQAATEVLPSLQASGHLCILFPSLPLSPEPLSSASSLNAAFQPWPCTLPLLAASGHVLTSYHQLRLSSSTDSAVPGTHE